MQTVRLKEGRYEVELPWREKSSSLVNYYRSAELRLRTLSRKLEKDPGLKKSYDSALAEMESNQVIEEVPPHEIHGDNLTFYMPHRPVVKESSVSTKVRPVFDASAKDINGLSLNDCLYTGPNLIPSLVD